jgi:hypothetical protein
VAEFIDVPVETVAIIEGASMVTLSLEVFVLIYLSIGLSLVGGLWVFFDRRDGHLYEAERARVIFHCIKCGRIYTARKSAETEACEACGFSNSRLCF